MIFDPFIAFHHRTFDLRQRPATEAEYLCRLPDLTPDDLARLMAQRNRNVASRKKPGALIITRKIHQGEPYWTPQPLERN